MKLFNLIIAAFALNVNGKKSEEEGKLQAPDEEYISYDNYANYADESAELKMGRNHGNG